MRGGRGKVAGVVSALGLCIALAALTPVAASAAAVHANSVRILYYEPFELSLESAAPGKSKPNTGTISKAHLNAYGRRFDLALEKNTRLTAALPASTGDGPTLTLYQGTLENIPGSWVRMSAKGSVVRGMIWDGIELYVVESAAVVRDSMVPPLQVAADGGSVVFKLSDTLIEPGTAVCATNDHDNAVGNGATAYKSLLNELKSSAVISQAIGASRRLQISALGDSLLRQQYASDQEARDEILLRLNNVDGIYTAQLGVEIQVPTLNVSNDVATDGLSATTVPADLLQELSQLRKQSPELRARGLTHLFTGRNLDGNTVGIAYRDTLCRQDFGAGLTEVENRGSWLESLIAAHEIGHNFGAVHDGEDDCASTPQGQFIMSPSVNQGISNFSQCSLNMMQARAQAASCITTLPPANLSIAADLGTLHQPLTRTFDWELPITNSGGSNAVNARVELLVPPVVIVDDAFVAGGSCTSGAGVISCSLGDIPGGAVRVVHLTLHSDVVGTNSVSAHVTSQNDASLANNDGYGTLAIDPEADLALTLQSPASIESGKTATATFTATNAAAIDAVTVNVEFTTTPGLAAAAAQISGGSCAVQAQSVRCTLPSLAANTNVSGTIDFTGADVGTATIQAQISSSFIDPTPGNDGVTKSITVTPVSSPSHMSNGSHGGGGSTNALWLLGLASLVGIRLLSVNESRRFRQTERISL
ncbi:MAG TPA: M12 family metallo-peptidase [Steroidobacteraceae bacterium]|jgi:hypothetical protein